MVLLPNGFFCHTWLLVQLSCAPILFGSQVAALSNSFLLSLPLIATNFVSSTKSDAGIFMNNNWCPWSPWSRCSPEPCVAGLQHTQDDSDTTQTNEPDSSVKIKRSVAVETDPILTNAHTADYCVVKPGPLANPNIHPLLVQATIDGVTKRREPAKQRVRTCACFSMPKWILRKKGCLPNFIQVECGQCGLNEKVYQTRRYEFDDSVLPFCDPSSTGSLQLYKILGGISGAIIVIIAVVWFVRILVHTVCRSSSTTSGSSTGARGGARRIHGDRGSQGPRRSRDGRLLRSRDNLNNAVDPLRTADPMFGDCELPPSYKDVVSDMPNVLVFGPGAYVEVEHESGLPAADNRPGNRRPKPIVGRFRDHESRDRSNNPGSDMPEEIASSSQLIARRSNTPPPPSYDDVMSQPVLFTGRQECVPMVNVSTTLSSGSNRGACNGQPEFNCASNSGDGNHSPSVQVNEAVGSLGEDARCVATTIQNPVHIEPQTQSSHTTTNT